MATLTLDGVRKSFGDREVVHGVSCAVADRELVVVVGPSGCGKSTLLRMVAGLEGVSAGTVAIDGRVGIKRLQQELGTTSLYVTHDQVEAMTLADRLIVMNAGNVDQIGPPLDLYERPETVFVAGFIGSPAMNLLAGRLEPGGVAIGDAMLPLDARRGEPGRP